MRTCAACTSAPAFSLLSPRRRALPRQGKKRAEARKSRVRHAPSGAQHAFDGRPDLRKAAMPLGRERTMPSAMLPVPG